MKKCKENVLHNYLNTIIIDISWFQFIKNDIDNTNNDKTNKYKIIYIYVNDIFIACVKCVYIANAILNVMSWHSLLF